ncbi:MAG: recombinase family protein [Anaerolineae bacterium]|nr:recombinase family protein [Anaerolineae bacterium]
MIYARLGLRELNKRVLEQRIAECFNWSTRGKFHVIATFTDRSCSGTNLDRPGFTEMCDFAIKQRTAIIITDLSQLTTDLRDAALVADVFDELGISVYSVANGLLSPRQLASLDPTIQSDGAPVHSSRLKEKPRRSGIPKSEGAASSHIQPK